MKLDESTIGQCCPKCRQVITKEVVETIRAVKIESYNRMYELRKAQGFKKSPLVNDKVVRYYFKKGTPRKMLAKRLGVHLTTIYRSLKRTEEKNL